MKHGRLRAIVAKAFKEGRLVRPSTCSQCGEERPRIVGHHDDYRKPLSVRWLCDRCHRRHHIAVDGPPKRGEPMGEPTTVARIGDRIATARGMRGISVEDLARLVGVDVDQITALERGIGSMMLPDFLLLCDACGIAPSTALR